MRDPKAETASMRSGGAGERKAGGRKEDIEQNVTSIGTEAGDSTIGARATGMKSGSLMIDGTGEGPNADMKVQGTCKFRDVSVPVFMIF
jgi:hypothetical protein